MSYSYGGRGRGKGYRWKSRGESSGNRYKRNRDGEGEEDSSSAGGRGGGCGRPPPGLKGREIGLWYRDNGGRRNAQINEDHLEKANAAIVNNFRCTLTAERQEHLTRLIGDLSTNPFYAASQSSATFQRNYQRNRQGNDTAAGGSRVKYEKDLDPGERVKMDVDVKTRLFTARSDPALDSGLRTELKDTKQNSKGYQEMLEFRKRLPAYKLREEIVELVAGNQVVIISGETGCGKTTQVAQFILESEIEALRGSSCNIICTQPRRISAISVAERVASERGEAIGDSVGYSIRLEHRFPKKSAGKITFMTTGIVFQILQDDKDLSNISHLIIDEVHERSIHSDFLITILKDILPRRPNLRVILMSATMNAQEFSNYYHGAPILSIPGFTFPITEYYLEDAIEHTGFKFDSPSRKRLNPQQQKDRQDFEEVVVPYIQSLKGTKKYSPSTIRELQNPESERLNLELILALIEHICWSDRSCGAILVFAPGWSDISTIIKSLESSGKFPASSYRLYPLHSMMPTINQREIFSRPPPGTRKIVVATQIAETSITIDDILWVIDCGKIKLGNFSESDNLDTLDVEWVSLANAQQRRGRAGRVQEGFVYHLFSSGRELLLEKFKKPEILRTRLEEVILQIKLLKLGKAADFLSRLLDPPSDVLIQLSLERLRDLNAIDDEEHLTPLGFHLAHLPMDPQTGKMILMGAIFSCADPIFSIAASLSFKDPFYRPLGKEAEVDGIRREFAGGTKSDHFVVAAAIKEYEDKRWERGFCHQNFLSEPTLKQLVNMKSQFAGYLQRLGFLPNENYKTADLNRNSSNLGVISAVTASGLYPNVARVVYKGRWGRVSLHCGTERVKLHPGSVNVTEKLFESPYLAYYKKMKSSSVFLYDTTMVSPFTLIFFGGHLEWKQERLSSEDDDAEEQKMEETKVKETVLVDSKYEFSYPQQQQFRYIIDSLRSELDRFLEYKVNNPGPMDWSQDSKEGSLLSGIIELLTSEYEAFMPTTDNAEDSGSESDRPTPRPSSSGKHSRFQRPNSHHRRRYYNN